MAQSNSLKFLESKHIFRLILGLPGGIFISEVLAMVFVQYIQGAYWQVILVDAVMTTALMLPLIYVLSYRPLLRHIAENDKAERIMATRLFLMEFAAEHTLAELLQAVLDEVEALVGAKIGFFHFLGEDQKTLSLQAWSTNTVENMCRADEALRHYPLADAGIWADCVRLKKPVIHNDPAMLRDRNWMPTGHAEVVRELTVPVLRNGRVRAIIGVGNKREEFSQEDVEITSTMADFAWDIVERKRAELELRASEDKFRTLVDWTYDWEQWVDTEGRHVYNSPSCERITGITPEELSGDPSLVTQIIHPLDQDNYSQHCQLVHAEAMQVSQIEFRIIDRDGREHWIEHICRPLVGDGGTYLGRRISNRDITVRKQAEQEILERNQKERQLIEAMHTMQLGIARDLHDTIGQDIGFLRMKLAYLVEAQIDGHPDLYPEISNLLHTANECYDLIRGTLDVLSSGGLGDPVDLLVQYAYQIGTRSGLRVRVNNRGQARILSPAQVRQLFLVFREAMSNIEKHAGARQISLETDWMDGLFQVRIRDDGVGLKPLPEHDGNHFGLKFMQERMEAVNGKLSIDFTEGQGTTVELILPVE